MRAALDGFYRVCGVLAATFLVLICALVVAQVVLNLGDKLLGAVLDAPLGLSIPSYSDFAGLFLAAGTFFALAYTFHEGGHIRVSLVLQALGPRVNRACDVLCLLIALGFSVYFAWYMGLLTEESLRFGDKTTGIVPIPLWIPQTAMTCGLIALAIAVGDDLVRVLRGVAPAFRAAEEEGLLNARTDPAALVERGE